MKKIGFALGIVLLAVTGCIKGVDIPSNVTGNWELVMTVGGLTGRDTVLPAPGDTLRLSFSADGKYNRTKNNQLTAQGSYSILEAVSIFSGAKQPAVHFDESSAIAQLINWNNGRLVLVDNNVDPFAYVYKRVD